ncbi:putative Uncharacterized sugar kinase YihV [Candidatus Zixiibacteriota bacterium]|nr:putative Uncharacterized sugar kinase YihV [candidate division Zixibacteria bacterium]
MPWKALPEGSKLKVSFDCLGLGIAPIDILYQIGAFPKPGSKIDALDITIQGGGPIPTAMVTLSRLGMKAALLAAVGGDLFGQFVIDQLRREKVDTSHIIIKKKPTAVACGWFEKGSGRRTIALNLKIKISPGDINLARLPHMKMIHLDGRDLNACMKLARYAKKIKIPVVFDIGSIRNDVSPIFPLVDHLVCSSDYALPFTQTKTILDSISRLRRLCPGTIVVTAGIDGSIGYSRHDGLAFARAYKVKTVDTTGAGDVYHGAYIYGLLKNWPLEKRMQFASAAAALKCTRPGGRLGIPDLKQVKKFMGGRRTLYA